jgi:hypothetical protein
MMQIARANCGGTSIKNDRHKARVGSSVDRVASQRTGQGVAQPESHGRILHKSAKFVVSGHFDVLLILN